MSGRYSPDHDDGGAGRPPSQPKRRKAVALKPGSEQVSRPPSTEVDKPGGRRARIEAVYAAMARNDALRRGEEADDG